jgi:hypothetical protein
MASISQECTDLKNKYETCFNKWYTEQFLKGNVEPACADLFQEYKSCVWVRDSNGYQ